MVFTLYSTTYCPSCIVVKNYMENNKIPYGIIFLDKSPEALSKFSSLGLRSVPVLDTGTQVISGADKIIKYLKVE